MKRLILSFFVLAFSTVIFQSCGDDETPQLNDSFERAQMLTFWADEIIIPAFNALESDMNELQITKDAFLNEQSLNNFEDLRVSWYDAYRSWQYVSMFEVGKAEEIGLRNTMNIFPTDIELIEQNVQIGNANLELPSNIPAQGFPALDYLLYGVADSGTEIFSILSQPSYSDYLSLIIDRMQEMVTSVASDWRSTFRDQFIANDGSSATASTDKMVNDFLFYYEKFFRAGKVGLPAGVFSGSENAGLVEAYYAGGVSKELFIEAFKAVQDFFVGNSFDGSQNGISLQDYLISLDQVNGLDNDLASSIISQWSNVSNALESVDYNFALQVENDNVQMLKLYDELQKAVILLKVEMMQLMNIQVDFVDADGD